MKKILILILLLFHIHDNLKAQSGYFNNIYTANDNFAGISIVKNDTTYSTLSVSFDTAGKICLVFCKFDVSGSLLLKKYFNDFVNFYYPGYSGCMQQVWDGSYIVSGAKEDTNGYTSAYLLKVNKDFEFEFIKEFTDTNLTHHAEFQQCKVTSNKEFIMTGAIGSTVLHNNDVLFVKTDSLGNQIFRKTYNLGAIDYARSIIETPDKGFLLGGYSWNYYSSDYSGDGRIIKLDSLGNFEWGRQFGGQNQDGPALVALAPDSNYIVATSYAHYTVPGGSSKLKINIIKINKVDGSTIWNRQYDTIRVDNYPKMVKILNDGNIIVVGIEDYWDEINYYTTSWILKLKPNGDSILFRRFYKYNDAYTMENTINDFCITEDKSIVSFGYIKKQAMYKSLWLVKMDSLGCLQPGCDPTASIAEPHYLKPGQLQIFPNPATIQTTITYTQLKQHCQLQIYNMLGQIVYEEKLPKGSSQCIINTTGFKPGLYKVVVGESSGTLIIK